MGLAGMGMAAVRGQEVSGSKIFPLNVALQRDCGSLGHDVIRSGTSVRLEKGFFYAQ